MVVMLTNFNFGLMKVINYDKCRRLLTLFQHSGKKMRIKELHEWIKWIDPVSLRKECHFAPFQKMVQTFENELIKDQFIASRPYYQSKLSHILLNLNFYSSKWIEVSSKRLLEIIQRNEFLKIEDLMFSYRMYIQMGWNEEKALQIMRKKGIELLGKQVEQSKQPITKICGYIHKHLLSLLLDPNITPQMVNPLLEKLRQKVNHDIHIEKTYGYGSTAVVAQMLKILKFDVGKGDSFYDQFLQKAHTHYRQLRLSSQEKEINENSSIKFNKKGQSIFQFRFQKNLQELGFLFERNKLIGLKEFDIVLKGRQNEPFRPFQRLLSSENISEIKPISKQEIGLYEKSYNLWKIHRKSIWPDPIVIDLNGPFHQVVGDKEIVLRSDQFKKNIATFYGYKNYTMINAKHWQENTSSSKASIEKYLKDIIDNTQF